MTKSVGWIHRPTLWLYAALLFLAVGTLMLTIWISLVQWNLPYYGLDPYDEAIRSPQHGLVTRVHPDGPAARTGIRVGDYIVTVEAPAVSNEDMVGASKDLGSQLSQKLIIQRDGQETVVTLAPEEPPFDVRIVRLEPLLVGLVFWGVSLFIWSIRPAHSITWLFFLLGQSSSAMLAVGSLSAIYLLGSAPLFRVLLAILAALAFHFYSVFPVPLRALYEANCY